MIWGNRKKHISMSYSSFMISSWDNLLFFLLYPKETTLFFPKQNIRANRDNNKSLDPIYPIASHIYSMGNTDILEWWQINQSTIVCLASICFSCRLGINKWQEKKDSKNKVDPNPVMCGAGESSVFIWKLHSNVLHSKRSSLHAWMGKSGCRQMIGFLFSQEMLLTSSLCWPLSMCLLLLEHDLITKYVTRSLLCP